MLTCHTREQAKQRAEAGSELHYSLAMSALHMGCLRMRMGLRAGKGATPTAQRILGRDTVSAAHADGLRVAVVRTSWNENQVLAVLEGLRAALLDAGVRIRSIIEEVVPGSHELPFTAQKIAEAGQADVICLLGAMVRGDVANYEYMAAATIRSFLSVSMSFGTPVVWGVRCVGDAEDLQKSAPGEAEMLCNRVLQLSQLDARLAGSR